MGGSSEGCHGNRRHSLRMVVGFGSREEDEEAARCSNGLGILLSAASRSSAQGWGGTARGAHPAFPTDGVFCQSQIFQKTKRFTSSHGWAAGGSGPSLAPTSAGAHPLPATSDPTGKVGNGENLSQSAPNPGSTREPAPTSLPFAGHWHPGWLQGGQVSPPRGCSRCQVRGDG